MDMHEPHVLIVGSGSAGKRHARNLSALGCRISAVDPRQDRREEIANEVDLVNVYSSLSYALGTRESLDGVAICSPPLFHVEQGVKSLESGLPVFLEKPVSPGLESCERLVRAVRETEVPLLLGYTWRWWPPLRRVKQILEEEEIIGRVLHVRCNLAAHLADWHPWERYQDFFMASADLGGGALLDESHWTDLMLWLFGMPSGLYANIERISRLEIETDDNVDMLLKFNNGPRVVIHLDLFGRPHQKSIRFVGSEGTLVWTEAPNEIRWSSNPTGGWAREEFDCERNDMFMAAAEEYLSVLRGADPRTCTIEDGLRVIRVIEAARRSHARGKWVMLE